MCCFWKATGISGTFGTQTFVIAVTGWTEEWTALSRRIARGLAVGIVVLWIGFGLLSLSLVRD